MPPTIVKNFRNNPPALDLAPTVKLLLRYVPELYLSGLNYIELTNSTTTRKLRRGKTWSRRKKVKLSECLGFYCGDHVTLLVDKLLEGGPQWVLRFPILRALWVGHVLYHEIGHHIHATQRPEYKEKEDVAEEWKRRLLRELFIRRYGYLRPVRKPLWWLLRCIGKFYSRSASRTRVERCTHRVEG